MVIKRFITPALLCFALVSAASNCAFLFEDDIGMGIQYSFGQPYDAAIDSTHLYIAGYHTIEYGSRHGWRVEKRSKTSGELEPAFGNLGVISTYETTPSLDHLTSIINDNGYLYLAGIANSQPVIQKRDAVTGDLITAFGNGGIVTAAALSDSNNKGLQLEKSGNSLYFWNKPTIQKYDATTGVLDPSFDVSSVSIGTIFSHEMGCIVGGFLFTVDHGTPFTTQAYEASIVKLDQITGALDTGFGNNGVLNTGYTSAGELATIACSDTFIIHHNIVYDPIANAIVGIVQKYDSVTGLHDSTFGTNGIFTLPPDNLDNYLFSSSLSPSGFVLAGFRSTSQGNWQIQKVHLDGSGFVSSFGASGAVYSNTYHHAQRNPPRPIVDGNDIYIVGDESPDAHSMGGSFYWHIEKRDLTTGALNPAFGLGGVIIER